MGHRTAIEFAAKKKVAAVVVEVAVAVEVVVVVVVVEVADLQISTTAVVEVGLQILRLAADPQIFRMPAAAAAECLESQKWIGFETELTAVVAVAGHQIGLAGRTWMPADLEADFQKPRRLQAVVQK